MPRIADDDSMLSPRLTMSRPNVPRISVIIATYNRTESAVRVLGDLAKQSLPFDEFEVVVVDDGSRVPAEPILSAMPVPFSLTVVTQPNGGPAVARNTGIERAKAPLIVSLDDDMSIGPDFLRHHIDAHSTDARLVVLGRVLTPESARLPLFERFQSAILDKLAADARAGTPLVGSNLYSGNVSFRRDEYMRVGGFDPSLRLSEDAELGMRFAFAGMRLIISEEAWSLHHSNHSSAQAWLNRAFAYGGADARVSAKHSSDPSTDPWRFIFQISRLTRPIMTMCALFPWFGKSLGKLAMAVATLIGNLRVERVAIAGATFAYGTQYFAGLGAHFGSRGATLHALRVHLNSADPTKIGIFARFAKFFADVRADHAAMSFADDKYQVPGQRRRHSMLLDSFRRIGFQMMVAYRLMRLFVHLRLKPFAMISARMIRHLYSADIHWDAELEPGVVLVHGVGLVISGDSRVSKGCILFQHVTLGRSARAGTLDVGAPVLESNVHVGPGATLLGPIRIGKGTKIVANSVVMESVAPNSIVEPASASVRTRGMRTAVGD